MEYSFGKRGGEWIWKERWAGYSNESGETSGSGRNEIFKAVLLGNSPFVYCSDGNAETMVITDIPALFDADDEVILFVTGAAGDMGGKVLLHKIGDEVYGYVTDNRTLVDLKMDGTYGYSDPTGSAEVGIAAVVDFSETGYTTGLITRVCGRLAILSAIFQGMGNRKTKSRTSAGTRCLTGN